MAKAEIEMNKRTFNLLLIRIKAILSTSIILFFAVVAFSGVGLYLAPSGKQARLSEWTFLGISKTNLQTMHDIPGLIIVGLLIVHFTLNLALYKNEAKILILNRRG